MINYKKINIEKDSELVKPYVYLYLFYAVFVCFFNWAITLTTKPIGFFLTLFIYMIIFIIFAVINHVFLRTKINHSISFLIEMLFLVSLLAMIFSNLFAEDRFIQGNDTDDLRLLIEFMINILSA